MDKNRPPKPNQGSSWNDEHEKVTNPNRRQEEDQDTNVESPRSGQRASNPDPGSSESIPSDKSERLQGDRGRQADSARDSSTTE
jgi:hypothetical protein